MKRLVVIGASGHGKVIADIAKKNGYLEILFLDDNCNLKSCGDYEVVGESKDASEYREYDFIVAIGNSNVRKQIQKQLIEKGLQMVSLIHPNAVIADNVEIGVGTVVMAGAVINPYVKIGQGCIINTCASIDHDCTIGDYVHVAVGTHVAGSVEIGDNTWIGVGATVSNNIIISCDCMIGAGAVVVSDISEPDIYIGVPARKMIK